MCDAFYSPTPRSCGAGLTTGYDGQIMHQPAWSLFDAIVLAGIQPTARGFRIAPELPFRTYSLSLPDIGVAYRTRTAQGYVVSAESQMLTMQVRPPAGAGRRRPVLVAGHPVPGLMRGGMLIFTLPARAHRAVSWAISPST